MTSFPTWSSTGMGPTCQATSTVCGRFQSKIHFCPNIFFLYFDPKSPLHCDLGPMVEPDDKHHPVTERPHQLIHHLILSNPSETYESHKKLCLRPSKKSPLSGFSPVLSPRHLYDHRVSVEAPQTQVCQSVSISFINQCLTNNNNHGLTNTLWNTLENVL